ncbi:hypothetical protein GCM10007893_25950 [Paracoccus marinus]|nr:hypothetical protein GCM10007893_25950 [Paracoccus marinus]
MAKVLSGLHQGSYSLSQDTDIAGVVNGNVLAGPYLLTVSGAVNGDIFTDRLETVTITGSHYGNIRAKEAQLTAKAATSAFVVTTTSHVEGRSISSYHGIVTGETILGANIFRDVFAGIRDIVGGRSAAYERSLSEARDTAIGEMINRARAKGANAVVGVDLDYEVIHSMLMVSASGTAVTIAEAG